MKKPRFPGLFRISCWQYGNFICDTVGLRYANPTYETLTLALVSRSG